MPKDKKFLWDADDMEITEDPTEEIEVDYSEVLLDSEITKTDILKELEEAIELAEK